MAATHTRGARSLRQAAPGAPARPSERGSEPMSRVTTVGYLRLRRALRVHGVRGTVRRGARLLWTWRAQRRRAAEDRAWDADHGVDTAGILPLEALDIPSQNRDVGNRYEPSSPDGFRALMAAMETPLEGLTFVDLGAGKGRALLLASELPFRRIVGVEFAPALAEIARQNIARYRSDRQRCRSFEIVCVDAVEYELPEEPCLVYDYNAFEAPIITAVLANLRRSYDRRPRPLLLVLGKQEVDSRLFAGAGFRRILTHEYGEAYEPAQTVAAPDSWQRTDLVRAFKLGGPREPASGAP
jgi:SAM-dependent methyltransferase